MAASKNDPDAVSIEDHLALAQQVDELKAQLAKVTGIAGARPVPTEPNRADLDSFDAGEYKHRESGEKFQLKVVKDDPQGRPHKLANDLHFHECSEDDLRKEYDKV